MFSAKIAVAFGVLAATAGSAAALDLVALSDRNELIRFESSAPQKTAMVAILGTAARVLAIDVRPADQKLYGVDAAGTIYRIDPATGMSEKVSTLSEKLESAEALVADFNPQANRLRLIGPAGQSLRVNVDNGQAIVDGRLAFGAGDPNHGKRPGVTAGAYINSVPGATQTQLFEYDSANGAYVIQDPPNDGTLASIGETGLPRDAKIDAMDIHTDAGMKNYSGFALAYGRLWSFSVTNGKMTEIGPVAAGSRKLVDLAVTSAP